MAFLYVKDGLEKLKLDIYVKKTYRCLSIMNQYGLPTEMDKPMVISSMCFLALRNMC